MLSWGCAKENLDSLFLCWCDSAITLTKGLIAGCEIYGRLDLRQKRRGYKCLRLVQKYANIWYASLTNILKNILKRNWKCLNQNMSKLQNFLHGMADSFCTPLILSAARHV